MADSTFLSWQDRNNDGLIDVCGPAPSSPIICLECSPNPKALVPNWRNRTIDEPFLNEKLCEYWITVPTAYTEISHNLEGKAEIQKTRAVSALLDIFDKDTSHETFSALSAALHLKDFDLDPRPNSRAKFLYGVSYSDLHDLKDAVEEDEEVEEEREDVLVTYQASSIKSQLIRVRKGLSLYSRFLKVYQGVEGGNLYFEDAESGESRAIFNLESYGDIGMWPSASKMGSMLVELDKFLNGKGLNIPGSGPIVFFQDRVVKIEILYSGEYDLKRMKVWTEDCGEKPKVYTSKLSRLKSKPGWRDRTARGYFAQLQQMHSALGAREAWPWIEFVTNFTYPPVIAVKLPTDSTPGETVGSCVMEALENEAKQLGQDILDDVFGLGDAIAYMFHNNLCQSSLEDVIASDEELGLLPNLDNPGAFDRSKVSSMATEQAFKKLKTNNPIGNYLCANVLGLGLPAVGGICGSAGAQMEALWKEGFDGLKWCGLLDLLMEVIRCLMGGLTLEEALASICESALQAMGIENFGDLFIGLDPEKQAALDALVKQKLSEGQLFKSDSQNAIVGDSTAGNYVIEKPWENQELIDKERKNQVEGPVDGMTPQQTQDTSTAQRRTLAQQFDMGASANQLDSNIVMQAYFKALLEMFDGMLLELVDILNKFPGAQLIAGIIALLDCPRPPIFNPSIMDFLKDLELPFCRNMTDITLPRIENPFGWLPKFKDIWRWLWLALKCAIQQLIVSILMKLLVKLCELLGDAICKALEVAGAMAAALVDSSTTFAAAIRKAICGEEADDAQVEATIEDLFGTLGAGGAAFGDREAVINFAEDIASSVTQRELLEGFTGVPSQALLNITDTLIEWEYPEFRDGLGGTDDIERFFVNVGKLLPVDFKAEIEDYLDSVPLNDTTPANPTLCATPKQLEDFKNLRCELLEGRATKEQCDAMYESIRGQFLDDLDDLGAVVQGGPTAFIMDNMPPIVSTNPDPDCQDGLIPLEPEEAAASAKAALGGALEQLKVDFSKDMLGNGGLFASDKDWGMINMILSDTMGKPYTAHKRKVFNDRSYVDFYVDLGNTWASAFDKDQAAFEQVSALYKQQGAYPVRVGGWLQDYMKDEVEINFKGNNSLAGRKDTYVSFETLGFTGLFGGDIDLLAVPDMGYNIGLGVNMGAESVLFKRMPRKASPDLNLSFRDNAKGLSANFGGTYAWGYDAQIYLSDLVQPESAPHNMGSSPVGTYSYADNARVKITEFFNMGVDTDFSPTQHMDRKEKKEFEKDQKNSIIKDRALEFVAIDDAFENFEEIAADYPNFYQCFTNLVGAPPETILLKEMINSGSQAIGIPVDTVTSGAAGDARDDAIQTLTKRFMDLVANNDIAFNYGAQFDPLTLSDIEYVTDNGVAYHEAVNDEGEPLSNDDMILGKSRDQYLNGKDARVIYLDPNKFGGTYMNPPLYIRPVVNKGWLGMVDVLFPDISPCKPQRTDLIDFGDIQDKINERYPQIPHDQRLKSDPDCVLEVPFNRILERSAKAELEGLISSAIRAFVSVEMLKGLATFSTFNPSCPYTYSKLFAAYVVELMEKGFKDPSTAPWDFFSPFSDHEFWYAFLETAVQIYNYRISLDEIQPPQSVLGALIEIDNMQSEYKYPYHEELSDAKSTNPRDAGMLETLKGYRESKNLEAVQKIEESAKIVLAELVVEQINYMGKKFVDNLKVLDIKPTIFDLDYYLLQYFAAGSELILDWDIKPEVVGLGEPGDSELYTSGKSFSDAETGEEYEGYYHVFRDPMDGSALYAAGEFWIADDEPRLLRPLANKLTVPIGDVASLGEASPGSDDFLIIEKYISINGGKKTPADALAVIKDLPPTDNISQHYPGSMENVYNDDGEEVGIKGSMGVRYGLQVSAVIGSQQVPITSVEVDSLDVECANAQPFEADSNLLYCLILKLREDARFKLLTRYILPLPKMVSLIAIYNSYGLLQSIGQICAETGDTFGVTPPGKFAGIGTKPGRAVSVSYGKDGPYVTDISFNYTDTDGWASKKDRDIDQWFVLEFDKWDMVLLRNFKTRLKKLFRSFYRSSKFTPGDDDGPSAGTIWLAGLRESFRPVPGRSMLPWWRRGRLRPNPFNAEEELCTKKD